MDGLFQFALSASQKAARSADPGRFAALAGRLRVLCDAETAKIAARSPSVACRPGCSHCCYRLVTVTVPEALKIVETLRAKGAEAVEETVTRLEAYAKAIEPLFIVQELTESAPCPFLAGDLCTIYEDRPLSCRGLNSRDAEVCKKWKVGHPEPRETQEIAAASVPMLQAPGAACLGAIVKAFAEEGRPSGLYELGATVLTLLKTPESDFDWSRQRSSLEKFKVISEFAKQEMPNGPVGTQLLQNPAFAKYFSLRFTKEDEAYAALRTLGKHPAAYLAPLDALPEVYTSVDHLEEAWDRFGKGIEAFETADLPPRETFDILNMFSPFLLAYAGKDVRPYMERFMGAAFKRCAEKAHPNLTAPLPEPRKPGRFRLGYVSYRLIKFNGTRWALGWLRNHGPDIETYAFNLNESEDLFSQAWRRHSDHYYHLPMAVPEAAALIRDFDLDAVIIPDIGMDGVNLQLALLRLGRRQYTAWGHPVTSGSPMIDAYLSSELMEPANGDQHYTERLIRLPGSGLCYPATPMKPNPRLSAKEMDLPKNGFMFCPQVYYKLLPGRDLMYKEIAERLGKPIIFLGPPALQDRLARVSRLLITKPFFPRSEYLRALQLADCILDPPDWNGGNSAVEALTLGRPVVTMGGPFMRGRHCLAFHTIAGVPGLIASDEADYIALACNPDRQAAAMEHIHAEALYDDLVPVRKLDEVLLGGDL
jgi:Fe-S-cluster containining protein